MSRPYSSALQIFPSHGFWLNIFSMTLVVYYLHIHIQQVLIREWCSDMCLRADTITANQSCRNPYLSIPSRVASRPSEKLHMDLSDAPTSIIESWHTVAQQHGGQRCELTGRARTLRCDSPCLVSVMRPDLHSWLPWRSSIVSAGAGRTFTAPLSHPAEPPETPLI